MQILQPEGWAPPKGYSNGVAARGTVIFVGGQIGWNARQQFESDDFVVQTRTALANVVAVLAAAGAQPRHITRMTWYVTDKAEYVRNYKGVGTAYREIIGRHFPAMTAIEVKALIEDRAKVEIEATAVVPDDDAEE